MDHKLPTKASALNWATVDRLHMNREIFGHGRCISVLRALEGSIISTLTDITDSWH